MKENIRNVPFLITEKLMGLFFTILYNFANVGLKTYLTLI
jgi:hypothetical protein